MKNHRALEPIAAILLIIGGLNWGLLGLFKWDLISQVFGEMTSLSRILFALIGIAALYEIFQWIQKRKKK